MKLGQQSEPSLKELRERQASALRAARFAPFAFGALLRGAQTRRARLLKVRRAA